MTTRFFAIAVTIFVGGCALDRNALDVGSNDAGRVTPGPDDTEACRNGAQLPIVGNWEGYIENFKLPSGSDTLRVTISSATTAQTCGKVTLGSAAPPPPPTDPELGHPVGHIPNFVEQQRTLGMTEGFPMTMVDGLASTTRMRFAADANEFWKSWCQMQTPRLQEHGTSYNCVEEANQFFPGACSVQRSGESQPIDCWKLALCNQGTCTCSASGCTAVSALESQSGSSHLAFRFDLRISGNEASGSANVGGNVYLTRTK